MDLSTILGPILKILMALPVIGPWLSGVVAYIVPLALGLVAVATAFVAFWHGLVALVAALASVPGLGFLKPLADWLKVEDDKVGGFITGVVIPFLNGISIIDVPSKPASASVSVASAGPRR